MNPNRIRVFFILFCFVFASATRLHAQTRAQGPWWPNTLWGAGDQSGGSNWITSEKVLKSIGLVKTGQVFDLGHVYEHDMPMVGKRSFKLLIPSFPTYAPTGKDSMVFNDEFVSSEIGQVGTQFDGPGHPGKRIQMADGSIADVFYNGFTGEDMKGSYGLQKLGVENVKPIITRGIWIDLAAYKNVRNLPEKYIITLADVLGALSRQGMKALDIEPGDALLFDMGWWRMWPDPRTVGETPPHPDQELIAWIISKKPSMIGSDLAFDSGPDFLLHENLIVKNGIFNLEFVTFESLPSENRKYLFTFIFTPIRLKGATGSPGRPIAVY